MIHGSTLPSIPGAASRIAGEEEHRFPLGIDKHHAVALDDCMSGIYHFPLRHSRKMVSAEGLHRNFQMRISFSQGP